MNRLSIRSDRLERLRRICLARPAASEKEAWGDPTWRVRDRIFAMQKGNVEGGRPSLWLKAPAGAQGPRTDKSIDSRGRAARMARSGENRSGVYST